MNKATELARKIKALTEKGATPGERTAAAAALKKIMQQHGLKLEDIEDHEEVELFWYEKNLTKYERQLCAQITGMVYPDREFGIVNVRKKNFVGGNYYRSEWIDIICRFELFINDYRRQRSKYMKTQEDLFVRAFVNKNNLFPTGDLATKSKKIKPLSPAEAMKMMEIMTDIQKVEYNKQLTS